ncbi:FbpB family small basic protein [Priestia megaterium]|nr:FbpB family small basic protein [Priestia megaterium]MED4059698.1 FbpB family small basic protein [Priestia megaterium]PES95298.1 FbpB family small basic protein [Priestia megaterium]
MLKHKKSFEEIVKENREELIKDKQAIEEIEKRIETKKQMKKVILTPRNLR